MSVSLLFLSSTGHSFRISHRAPRRAIPFSLFRAPSTVAPTEREGKGTLRGPEIFFPLVIFAAEERTNGRRAEEHQRGGGPLFFIPYVRSFVALSRCRQARRARNACGGVEEEGGAPLCQFARNFPTCSMLYAVLLVPIRRGEKQK